MRYFVDSYSADIPQVQPQSVSCRGAPYSLCPLIGDCVGLSCSLQNDDIQELHTVREHLLYTCWGTDGIESVG